MRVALRRLALFGIVWTAFLPARLGAADAPGRVVVDGAVFDFGTVEQGAHVEHVFRLRNAGTEALRVDHVKGTCACTVGVATGEAIAPGDEAWVTVSLDTTRLAGRTTKTATVYTSDPVTPTVPVTLTGEVLTDLVVRPAPLYVGHLPHGAVVRREVAVTPGRPGGTASVVSVEPSSPRVRAWLAGPSDGGGQRIVVEIEAKSAGRFSDDVVIRTTSERQPTLTLKVLGAVDGDENPGPRD